MPTAPVAKKVPRKLEAHGDVREDPYYWLNQREDPEVIAYLEAENEYTRSVMAHTEKLQETLFEEIKGRLDPDDSSVPYRKDDFYYYYRFEEGKEYAIHCRKRGSLDADEEILANGNALSEGHEYFSLHVSGVSVDHNLLAYAIDTKGRRIYDIYFKTLGTGKLLDDVIGDVTGSMAWASDNQTVFYSKQHPETLRAHQVYRHRRGTNPADDVLVFAETDETFHVDVFKTKSKRFIMISSDQTLTSEYRFLPADEPDGDFRVLQPRERKHEYSASHFEDHFFILTNDDAVNFRLMKTPVNKPGKEHWEEVIPHRADVLDDTIPLTTGEYDEWGNPNDKKFYDYILSYSPYDNVEPKAYPNLLVTTGLHDSQVQYWEPQAGSSPKFRLSTSSPMLDDTIPLTPVSTTNGATRTTRNSTTTSCRTRPTTTSSRRLTPIFS